MERRGAEERLRAALAYPPFRLLAERLPGLCLVGGAVRNLLLGCDVPDCDLAAAYTEEQVRARLSGTPFRVSTTSKKLGTLKLSAPDLPSFRAHMRRALGEGAAPAGQGDADGAEAERGFAAEYTAFRVDSYADDGNHAPTQVRFGASLSEDALRRDFTVNALYLSLSEGKILDPTGGMAHLQARLLCAVRDPGEVFREDGLRLLRMVRFAATYGLRVAPDTFAAARDKAELIRKIKPERVREELNGILLADRYGQKGAPRQGVELLRQAGLLQWVLPELVACVGVKQRPDYHRYDVYGHALAVLDAAPPCRMMRWAALLHDIAKPVCVAQTGKMAGHDGVGADMTRAVCQRLRFSNQDRDTLCRLVANHMFDLRGDARPIKVQRFVRANRDLLPLLCALMDADAIGAGMGVPESRAAARLRQTLAQMQQDGVPFTVGELQVKGDDLIALGIPPERRKQALDATLDYALEEAHGRTRAAQLAFLQKFAARTAE